MIDGSFACGGAAGTVRPTELHRIMLQFLSWSFARQVAAGSCTPAPRSLRMTYVVNTYLVCAGPVTRWRKYIRGHVSRLRRVLPDSGALTIETSRMTSLGRCNLRIVTRGRGPGGGVEPIQRSLTEASRRSALHKLFAVPLLYSAGPLFS